MTNYLRRNKKIPVRYFVLAIILILVIFFPTTISNLSVYFFGNIFSARAAVVDVFSNNEANEDTEELQSEIRRLKTENALLLEEIIPLDRETLRASVLAIPPLLPFDTLLLGSGEDTGVHVGDVVFLERVLLGTIESVTDSYAKATLLSSPGKIIHASIGEEHIPVELRGLGGGGFTTRVAAGVRVHVGDLVSVAGAPDLILGTVSALPPGSTPSFQDISITIPFSLSSLRFVEIIPEHTFPISL